MKLNVKGDLTPYNPATLNIRCPSCRHAGAFHGVGVNDVAWNRFTIATNQPKHLGSIKVGVRQCPNRDCRSIVFFAEGTGDDAGRQIFRPEVIDFDATNLPPDILSSLE